MAELFTFEVVVKFLFLRMNGRTYERTDIRTYKCTYKPDNYNDQDTIQTVSIWLKNYPYYYPYYPMGPLLLAPAGPIIFFHALFTKKTKNQNYIAIPFICHPGDLSAVENDQVIHV